MQYKLRHILLPIVHAFLDVLVMRRLLEAKTATNLHQCSAVDKNEAKIPTMTISSLPLMLNDNSLISVLISVKNKTKFSIKNIQSFLLQQVWDNCVDLQDSCADMAMGMGVARVVEVYLALRIFCGVDYNLKEIFLEALL